MFHAIKTFFRFLYHFFFIDQEHGRLSQTKFFSIIGYGIWCWAFPYAVIFGSKASFDLWIVFGAVVIGNRTLNKYMENKGGTQLDEKNTWKNKADDSDPDSTDDDAGPGATVTATTTVTAPDGASATKSVTVTPAAPAAAAPFVSTLSIVPPGSTVTPTTAAVTPTPAPAAPAAGPNVPEIDDLVE